MRRDPKAVVAAHRMDRERRELYVEGVRDKSFLEWLVEPNRNDSAIIRTIDFVDIPDVIEGGNRERIVRFLEIIDGDDVQIRGLIDADHEHLRSAEEKRSYPSKIYLTDWRSLESYVLTIECLDRALRLGCSLEAPTAASLFSSIAKVVRDVSGIRFLSESEELRLPLNEYRWLKHVAFSSKGGVTADLDAILRSLMQAAKVSLSRRAELMEKLDGVLEMLAALDDLYVLHGKDFMKILTAQLRCMGVSIDDAGRLMWTSFRRSHAREFPNLSKVMAYLCSPEVSSAV
ncbi:hypothetical protein [Nonomuraea sp. NPDC023979]|uniref:hypothetical protein n=1 Tax=Nonomuraea sp. NPDC023979 TaxID=3154796 RepID=UPI0033F1A4FF